MPDYDEQADSRSNRNRNRSGNRGDHRGGHRGGPGGNTAERLNVSTGILILIDQFMLANRQFVEPVVAARGAAEIGQIVRKFGGQVIELPEGHYEVMRDPQAKIMLIAPPQSISGDALQQYVDGSIDEFESQGLVYVDTRCLVAIDASVFSDSALLEEYSSLRKAGDMKAGRDLLRNFGAAVRYGFNPSGDELGVFKHSNSEVVGLWPDFAIDDVAGDRHEASGNRAEVREELSADDLGEDPEENFGNR